MEDLSRGIKIYAKNKGKLGKEARETILKGYSYEKVGKLFQQLCKDVMER